MRLYPKNVLEVIRALPNEQAVLIRGPHGIGKSDIGRALGALTGRAVIDRRLAQMSEGDFVGLPKLYDDEFDKQGKLLKRGRTEFMPPEWFVKIVEEPSVLFLDELNRATPELQAAAFELVLDRTLQGRRIHPETMIIAAINATMNSAMYQVTDLDPALLDRFLVIDMIPSIGDWREWAVNAGLNSMLIEFCVENQAHWWFDPASGHGLEPNKVYPTPRSWHKLDKNLSHAGLYANTQSPILPHIACGLVGTEAGAAFTSFIRDTSRMVTADDIINKYDAPGSAVVKRIKEGALSAEQQLQIVERLVDHHKSNEWTAKQAERIKCFFDDINSAEIFFAFWAKITQPASNDVALEVRKQRQSNAMMIHRVAREMIMLAATSGRKV